MATESPEGCDAALSAAISRAALEEAEEKCDGKAAILKFMTEMMGVGELHDGEPDANCEEALAEGLSPDTLSSTEGRNQWVVCRAWQLVREEGMDMSEAFSEAWGEVREAE